MSASGTKRTCPSGTATSASDPEDEILEADASVDLLEVSPSTSINSAGGKALSVIRSRRTGHAPRPPGASAWKNGNVELVETTDE